MAKAAFGQLRKILVNLGVGRGTRVRVLRTYVWSVLLFVCEAWTKGYEKEARGSRNVVL